MGAVGAVGLELSASVPRLGGEFTCATCLEPGQHPAATAGFEPQLGTEGNLGAQQGRGFPGRWVKHPPPPNLQKRREPRDIQFTPTLILFGMKVS